MKIKLFFNEEPVKGKYEYIIPGNVEDVKKAADSYQWFVESVNRDAKTVNLKTINPDGVVAFKEASYDVNTGSYTQISNISMRNGNTWFYFGFDKDSSEASK